MKTKKLLKRWASDATAVTGMFVRSVGIGAVLGVSVVTGVASFVTDKSPAEVLCRIVDGYRPWRPDHFDRCGTTQVPPQPRC